MSKPEDQNDLKAFEARLAALVPRDDRLDRERLAFLTGQASVMNAPSQRNRVLGVSVDSRAWPAAFAAMSAVAATLFVTTIVSLSALSFLYFDRAEPNEIRVEVNTPSTGDLVSFAISPERLAPSQS